MTDVNKKDNRFDLLYTDEVKTDYFHWLTELVGVEFEEFGFWLLLKQLHKRKFYWSVPNDDNRADDGLMLRTTYINDTYYMRYKYHLDGDCTVLEMLVALAIRINDIMFEPEEGDNIGKWFWEMMDNIGLSIYTDEDWVDLDSTFTIDKCLTEFLDRQYLRNGSRGLFPLKNAKKDQREVEIWYQMHAYLQENY